MRVRTYEEIINSHESVVFMDVRTPLEYEENHIPGAVNVPIFDNEERATIGTLHKKESPRIATKYAMDCISRRLPEIYSQIEDLDTQRKTIICYCARGGMRSSSIVGLFNALKFNMAKLDFGYKGYRAFVNEHLPIEFEKISLVTLYGKTGTGKTKILHELKSLGYEILDLEGAANHRGSSLGAVGLSAQHSQKKFESIIFDTLLNRKSDIIFTEGESKRIGKIVMQDFMYNKLLDSRKIFIDASLDFRTNIIQDDYINNSFNNDDILAGLEKLRRYISTEKIDNYIALINDKNYGVVIKELMVNYYDNNYRCNDKVFETSFINEDNNITAKNIASYIFD